MKKTFLVCSLNGRINGLIKLISSLSEYKSWNIDIILQNYPKKEIAIIEMHVNSIFGKNAKIFITGDITGPHLARCVAFDNDKSDVWCILDDDMFAVENFTDYEKMSEIIFSRYDIGLLSSNWRRTTDMLQKIKLSDKLAKQNIVYTGGGMMLRQDVAEIIKAIPRKEYLFDNPLWSIYSYISGYDNYRYFGSASVHQICTKGGRRKWLNETDTKKSLPPCQWIVTRKGKSQKGGFNEFLICDSNDITSEAHILHEQNNKRRIK